VPSTKREGIRRRHEVSGRREVRCRGYLWENHGRAEYLSREHGTIIHYESRALEYKFS
jgi:hypothetical protein